MTAIAAASPRCVVITGASRGLGAALARHYAAPGVRLLLVARRLEPLMEVAAQCSAQGAMVESFACDVRDQVRLTRELQRRDAEHPIDLVVANAGMEASLGAGGAPESVETVFAQIDTNLAGALVSVLAVLPQMQERRRGSLVLVSSLAALQPLADQPTYCATKAGLLAWGEAARPWLARFDISVTVACPGFIATGMAEHYAGWRPLEWSADKAARAIAKGAARGRAVVAFPWVLRAAIGLGRLVPRGLREAVAGRLFKLEVK